MLTGDSQLLGTPPFMAPESIEGSAYVDARSDIYALGCVAYWLATGELLFDGETPMQILFKHSSEEPIPPSQRVNHEIPQAFEDVIMNCLEKNREDRPQTALELRDMLHCLDIGTTWTQVKAQQWWEDNARGTIIDTSNPGDVIDKTEIL